MSYVRRFPRSFFGIASLAEFQAASGLKVGDLQAELRETSVVISSSQMGRQEIESAVSSALQGSVCTYCGQPVIRGFSKVRATCFVQFCCVRCARLVKGRRLFFQGKEVRIQENKAFDALGERQKEGQREIPTVETSYSNGFEQYLQTVFGEYPGILDILRTDDYFADATHKHYALLLWHSAELVSELPELMATRATQLTDIESALKSSAPQSGIKFVLIPSPASGWLQIIVQTEDPLTPEQLLQIRPAIFAETSPETPLYFLWDGEKFNQVERADGACTQESAHRYVVVPEAASQIDEEELVAALFDTFQETTQVAFPRVDQAQIKSPVDLEGAPVRIECPGFAFDQPVDSQTSALIVLTTSAEIQQGLYQLSKGKTFQITRLM